VTVDTALINSMIDIRKVAEQAGAEFRKNRSKCPVHGGENPTAFEIFDNGRAWTCHTRDECNRFGHDGIGLVRVLNNWAFNEIATRYTATPEPINPQEQARRAVENAERIERELKEKIEQAQKAIEELRKARRWLEYHANMGDGARELWRERGVPDSWQNYWKFGYSISCPTYYQSPSLTIPIYDPGQPEPLNIRHRLLSPDPGNPADKYRPEKTGMPAYPFYAEIDLPLDRVDRVVVVEGEIKSAVTFLTWDKPLVQVIGIPGKSCWGKLSTQLQGRKDTVILLDPDAKLEAVKMARSIGGCKVADLPEKIDDMILNYSLGQDWLESVFRNARMVV
jgi:hypothetical protein